MRELSHEKWGEPNHYPCCPMWTEGLHTFGGGMVRQRNHLWHAITTPMPCKLWHDNFHLGLSGPELLPSMYHSNSLLGITLHTCYHLPHDPGYKRPANIRVNTLRTLPPHLFPSSHNTGVQMMGWNYGRQVTDLLHHEGSWSGRVREQFYTAHISHSFQCSIRH